MLSRPLLLHGRVSPAFGRPGAPGVNKMNQHKHDLEDTPLSPPSVNNTPHGDTFGSSTTEMSSATPAAECIVQLDGKLRKIETMVAEMAENEDPERGRDLRILRIKWRNVSMVMDRMFFVLYLVVIIITMLILFPYPT